MTDSKIARAIRQPGLAWSVATSTLRGMFYRFLFRVQRRRIVIGRGFRVDGKLDIRGPGTVIFGDYCTVVSSRYQPTTPWTHDVNAVIRIGDRVVMSGTRLGCQELIEIGDLAGLADAHIMDTDFHSTEGGGKHRVSTRGVARPVRIGKNVWLGTGSMVLKGSNIGDNAVVGAGAVVTGNVPANAVAFGNPARVIWNLTPPK